MAKYHILVTAYDGNGRVVGKVDLPRETNQPTALAGAMMHVEELTRNIRAGRFPWSWAKDSAVRFTFDVAV